MTWNATGLAHFASGAGSHFEHLIWMRVKSLDGASQSEFGFWSGKTDRTFTVEGASRAYFGAQTGLRPPAVQYEKGLSVQVETFAIGLSPEVEAVIRGYHCADAPFEYHVALFHSQTRALIDIARRWRGFIDSNGISIGASGGSNTASFKVSTKNMIGTTTVPGGKSDADQRRRNAADGFLKDASIGTVANDPHGSKA